MKGYFLFLKGFYMNWEEMEELLDNFLEYIKVSGFEYYNDRFKKILEKYKKFIEDFEKFLKLNYGGVFDKWCWFSVFGFDVFYIENVEFCKFIGILYNNIIWCRDNKEGNVLDVLIIDFLFLILENVDVCDFNIVRFCVWVLDFFGICFILVDDLGFFY